MSYTIKIAIALVMILAVIVIGWIWLNNSNSQPITLPASDISSNSQNYVDTTRIKAVEKSPATANSANSATLAPMIQNTDTSTAGLQKDIDDLNAELNGLNADSGNIDQGLSASAQ